MHLEVCDGVSYEIPPAYEKLAESLNLPTLSEMQVEDCYLKGTLDLGSLAEILATKRCFEQRPRVGIEDSRIQYDSLHDRIKALSSSGSSPKFSLEVTEAGLNSLIPEGAAGNIPRLILSDSGVLQVYYVKILEKGDTYEVVSQYYFFHLNLHFSVGTLLRLFSHLEQIIERSLPKKKIVKKNPSMVQREEMDKIGKVWVSLVRKDIPKHHRVFTSFHRKQMGEAKRVSESCLREACILRLVFYCFYT